MPPSFIVAILFLALALLVLAFGRKLAKSRATANGKPYGNPLGWGKVVTAIVTLLTISGLFTLNASFNQVPVRNVGIVTEFNKPTGQTTGSGAKFVSPWDKIEKWNANYELWDHRTDNGGKGMLVKIAGNQDAWVPVSVEYAPNPEDAPQDFVDYARDRDNWIARRVEPTLTNAVAPLFRTHDPLAKANVDPVTGQISPPDMTPYVNQLNAKLKAKDIGFKIRNLYMGTIVYNDTTTKGLNEYAGLVLENRNLIQQNKNQDEKNRITAKQALVDKETYCLQIQEKTGTVCLLNSNSPVIVDATPKK
jgi:hypothetical protein